MVDYYRKIRMDQDQTALRANSTTSGTADGWNKTRIGFFAQQVENSFQSTAIVGKATLNVYQPYSAPLRTSAPYANPNSPAPGLNAPGICNTVS